MTGMGFCLNCGFVPLEEALSGHVCEARNEEDGFSERDRRIIAAGHAAMNVAFEDMTNVLSTLVPDASEQERFSIIAAIIVSMYAGMLDTFKRELGEEVTFDLVAGLWDNLNVPGGEDNEH